MEHKQEEHRNVYQDVKKLKIIVINGHHQLVALHFIRYIHKYTHTRHLSQSTWPSNDAQKKHVQELTWNEKMRGIKKTCTLHDACEMHKSIYPNVHLFCHTSHTHRYRWCPMETFKNWEQKRQELGFVSCWVIEVFWIILANFIHLPLTFPWFYSTASHKFPLFVISSKF